MTKSINLLPLRFRKQQLVTQVSKSWLFLFGFATLLMIGGAWWTWNQNSSQKIVLDATKLQYAPVQRLAAESKRYRVETESMQQRERLALELSRHRSILALLGQLSISAKNCEGNVSIKEMTLDSELGAKDEHAHSKLTLTGVGIDDVAIAQFVAELRDSEMFESVQLTSSGSTVIEDYDSKLYTLECSYQ